MMDANQPKQLFGKAHQVKLDEKTKDVMRQELLVFMKANPVMPIAEKTWFANFARYVYATKPGQFALAGLLICFFAAGIASAKAGSALPGDFLYPVKTGFNERVMGILAFSDKAKLQLSISLAELRLQEAEKITVAGNTDNQSEISSNFKHQTNQALEYISKLNKSANSQQIQEIAASFEASLKAHSIIIHGLKASSKKGSQQTLLDDVENATLKVSGINQGLNQAAASLDATQGSPSVLQQKNLQQKISTLEHSVRDIKKLIEHNKNKIGRDGVLQSTDNLNLVQKKLDEQKNNLSAGSNTYQSSISSLQEAAVIAKESEDLINAKTNLGVNVPININAEGSDAADKTYK